MESLSPLPSRSLIVEQCANPGLHDSPSEGKRKWMHTLLEGMRLGPPDGFELGLVLGCPDGLELGSELGVLEGLALGFPLGISDGLALGMRLGPPDGSFCY